MEVWRLVEGSIALAELTRAVARVLEGGDTGEQDRRQVTGYPTRWRRYAVLQAVSSSNLPISCLWPFTPSCR